MTQYFPPETGAAPERAWHMCQALIAAGHEVVIVTGLPNHPSGEILPQYRSGVRIERQSGLEIRRVSLYASPRKDALRRFLNQISFAWTSWLELRQLDPCLDVVVASIPPTFLGVGAAWLARRRHVPFLVDVRDDWPRAAVRLGFMNDGLLANRLQRISDTIYDRADQLILVTPSMLKRFENSGIAAHRLALVMNGADLARYERTPEDLPLAGTLRVVYAGTHGLVHGMDAILDAAAMLGDCSEFLLVGDGVRKQELMSRAEADGLSNVRFEGSVQPDELPGILGRADVCLATTGADEFCGETIPVKVFEYMAASRPIVAAVRGDAAEVIERSGAGIVVDPEDGVAIAEALKRISMHRDEASEMARRGRDAVIEHYSRAAQGRQFVSIVEHAVLSHRNGRAPLPAGAYAVIKRLSDIVISALALSVLLPLVLLISGTVLLDSRGPVLFRQRRSGRWTHEFWMLKFRTMHSAAPDVATHLLGDPEQYLTRSGRWLRRTSLDELPQLINVLRGDMSLVGPRPALYNQFDLIGMRREGNVDSLRPGITGWAQVNGRDDVSLQEKVALDVEYRDNVSFWFDLRCVLATFGAVFSQRGAR